MSGKINFKINGRDVQAQRGETILQIARRENIYIPTMCYISKTTPCASCRMCVVSIKDVDGFVLSCNTPATNGIEVITDNHELHVERTNIMKLYDVNHPLECGVCDKSGECDLQNKTLEFDVGNQNFSARDQQRKIEHWGLINYDPALCILCEKCTHVCNEVIGDDAITLQFGGYNSKVIPKNSDTLDCTFCGECIAVCPVGALVSSDFQYKSNAWELKKIPAICAHCSAGCSLEYEVKHTGVDVADDTIYRVTNNFEFTSLCGAGRFGFDFDTQAKKDLSLFNKAIEAIKTADAIRFSSMITNEEAWLLNQLKDKLGIKLFNEDARLFAKFMDAYSSISGQKHYSADLEQLRGADSILMIGSMIASDNPGVRYAITTAARHNGAKVIYAHPVEDDLMQNVVTQFLKYEVATEEGVLALIAKYILSNCEVDSKYRKYLDNLDIGYLSAESNIGEDELELMMKTLFKAKKNILVIGTDIVYHKRASNIAKLVALIEKYSDFSVLIVPRDVNSLGVSLICDLDKDEEVTNAVGYNAKGDFIISSLPDCDLAVPALNQQEGTFVSIDKRVLATNPALSFDGYELNDIVKSLGIDYKNTIDITKILPLSCGFKGIEFDNLNNFLSPLGEDIRGYKLDDIKIDSTSELEDIDDLPELNGTIIYHVNPVLQFNRYTNSTKLLEKDTTLRGSAQFATAARIKHGDNVEIILPDNTVIKRRFKEEPSLKGMIALNPTFDMDDEVVQYRFQKSQIKRVNYE